MFTKAKRNALLKLIQPLASQAQAARIYYEAKYAATREELLDRGVTGDDLKRQLKKRLPPFKK